MNWRIFKRTKNGLPDEIDAPPSGSINSGTMDDSTFAMLMGHLNYELYSQVRTERGLIYRRGDAFDGKTGIFILVPRKDIPEKILPPVELSDGSLVRGKSCPECGRELSFSDCFYYCDNAECSYFDIPVHEVFVEDVIYDAQEDK